MAKKQSLLSLSLNCKVLNMLILIAEFERLIIFSCEPPKKSIFRVGEEWEKWLKGFNSVSRDFFMSQ